MVAKINEVKSDGIVTRDELLAMGCMEVTSRKGRQGRNLFTRDGEVIAAECTKCLTVRCVSYFGRHKISFAGIRTVCRECNSEQHRRHRIEYPEYHRERLRNHRIDNPGYYREWERKNREDNPEICRMKSQRRRALIAKLPSDESIEQRIKVWKDFGNSCALTGEQTDITADHAIPLNAGHGGTNYGNMYPLNGRLNYSKNDRHLYEWFDANKNRFNLEQSCFNALIEYLADANEMTAQEYRKYVDWCFDNPRVICPATGELVFERDLHNERKAIA